MKLNIKSLAGAVVLTVVSITSVFAGPSSDRLAQCLVQKTTSQDHILLIQWVFSAMAAHPSMKNASTITEAQAKAYNQDMAKLFMRLITEDCRNETKEALDREGDSAIEGSFSVLGQVAMGSLMQNEAVQNRMMGFVEDLDMPKLQGILK